MAEACEKRTFVLAARGALLYKGRSFRGRD